MLDMSMEFPYFTTDKLQTYRDVYVTSTPYDYFSNIKGGGQIGQNIMIF